MTEEDQLLVAKAALAGVRFWRTPNRYWKSSEHHSGGGESGGKFTIGRAAAYALLRLGMMTEHEHDEYEYRTCNQDGPVEVDISALAGRQLEVAKAEEPTP